MRRIFNLRTLLGLLYIVLIIVSFLLVPYHNIRTGFTNWGLTGGIAGPINAAALSIQRALTFVLIIFYVYNLRIRRKIREDAIEIDMAIQESEDRRHRVEREFFRLKRQMQTIFDSMEEMVFICNKDFKIEFMNKAIKKEFGDEMGRKCFEVMYKRSESCPWCKGFRVFEGELVVEEKENELNKKTYRMHKSPFINPDGSVSMISIARDITKEIEIKKKLENSEEYFRDLFDNLPIACFGYDRDGNFVAWNKAATKLYGFNKEDIVGRSMFDTIVQKKDIEATKGCIKDVFDGKSFDSLEWQDSTKEGKQVYVYANTYPIYGLDGRILMGLSAGVDITPQKEIENELQSSKEHLEKIMETPKSLIVELDTSMNIVRFNKGCEEVTGYLRHEVMGKNWLELFIPERLKDVVRNVLEHIKRDSGIIPHHFESPILTKKGRERIIFWSNANLKDDDGKVISMIAIGEDITERKRIQQTIVDAEEKFRDFIENVPVHVGVIDESGKFVAWNKHSEEMFGYTKEEAVNKISPSDIHETPEEACQAMEIAARDGLFDKELNLVAKNGVKVPARLVVFPKKKDGKITGFCGFAEDISKQKKAEDELTLTMKKLDNIALKDSLTGLFNSHYIMERLASEFERSKRSLVPLSLLLIDLDYFKTINDTHGFEVGDMVLVQIAKILKFTLRLNDVIARWSGEEFMIILPEVDREYAIYVAERIQSAFKNKSFGDDKRAIKLTLSIGMVSYPEDPLFNSKEMIDAVEKSVFAVKAAGGNGIGSYLEGLLKDKDKSQSVDNKVRLLDALKKRMSFFAGKGEDSATEAIYSLAKSLELKDHTTRKHADETIHYAVKLAQKLGMNDKDIEDVRRAAILHDIGKLGIPDEILLKPGSLTKEEYDVVKKHPDIAADIMSVVDFLKNSIAYVLYHHERFDGNGYPKGLKGQDIPLGARIISVVDVFEALTSDRPYHKAIAKDEALQVLRDNSGSQFDPTVVNNFIEVFKSESS